MSRRRKVSFFLVAMLLFAIQSQDAYGSGLAKDSQLQHHGIVPSPYDPTHRFLRQTCHLTADCPPNAACTYGSCDCKMGFLWNRQYTQCTPANCSTTKDCLKWSGTVCEDAQCLCEWYSSLDEHQVACSRTSSTGSLVAISVLFAFLVGGLGVGWCIVAANIRNFKSRVKKMKAAPKADDSSNTEANKSKKI